MPEQMLITYSILPTAYAVSYFNLVSSSYNIRKPGIFKGDVCKGGSKVFMSIIHADHCSKDIAYGSYIDSFQPTKLLAATCLRHYEVCGNSLFLCSGAL